MSPGVCAPPSRSADLAVGRAHDCPDLCEADFYAHYPIGEVVAAFCSLFRVHRVHYERAPVCVVRPRPPPFAFLRFRGRGAHTISYTLRATGTLSVGSPFANSRRFAAQQCFRSRVRPHVRPASRPTAHGKELVMAFPTVCGRPPAPTGTAGSVHLRPEFCAERRLPWCSRVFMM